MQERDSSPTWKPEYMDLINDGQPLKLKVEDRQPMFA
jgi:hypothetical protein